MDRGERRSPRLLHEGHEIHGGKYVVERFLGEGAFAEVYRVRHAYLGRQALKVFRGAGMTRSETENLLGEAILLSQFGHPNVVRVFDADTIELAQGPCGYFTMEYVAGGTLAWFWRSHDKRFVPVDTVVDIIAQVCRGLAVAHDKSPPIVHRDIKPQNILVGYDASGLRVRVSDFGLAKQVNPLSLMASARGTVAFKAPETFVDPDADSCAGDVWALGTVAYLLLTDHLPHEDLTERELAAGAARDRPILVPSRLNLDVDAELERIVLTALAPRSGDRYPTAAAMLDDLVTWSTATRSTGKVLAPALTSKVSITTGASSFDEAAAEKMVERALVLAKQAADLSEAADLMEEAFNKWPGLRDRYAGRVRLWRRGIVQ